jgi:CTP synthase (UTP-ammonia lyase)
MYNRSIRTSVLKAIGLWEHLRRRKKMIRIGLIGDVDQKVKAHVAIPKAIELAANALAYQVEIEWLATPQLQYTTEQKLAHYHALWAIPGTPYASMDGALKGIQFAREHALPFLGTCGGFQHMVIEYARNVLGFAEADHAESNSDASMLLIAPLTCSFNEDIHTFTLAPNSRIATIYGQSEIVEQYGICNYGLNRSFESLFAQGEMSITGVDRNGEVRVLELAHHPFFIGTLFQPERSAFQHIAHPVIKALLQATNVL